MTAPDTYSCTRRDVLKGALGAAALGFTRVGNATESGNYVAIDTHVYFDHWPLERFRGDEPEQLAALLRRAGINQAWAGSFDGLFHKDIHGVNARVAECCSRIGDKMFVPFGSINPTLPDWAEDVRRCCDELKMPGIRLHPAYHGYALDDPRFEKLLDIANDRALIVQVVGSPGLVKRKLLSPTASRLELGPLVTLLQDRQRVRAIVYADSPDDAARSDGVRNAQNLLFGYPLNAEQRTEALNRDLVNRTVFGSAAPMFGVNSALELAELRIFAEQSAAIRGGTALQLLADAATPARQ